jgi:hypothetical protein
MKSPRVPALLLVVVVLVSACSQSEAEGCAEYLTDFAAIVVPAGDDLLDRAVEFQAVAKGELELSVLTDGLARSAAEMEAVLSAVDQLGTPPEALEQGVELVVEGVDLLQEAFELDDGLGYASDPELLDQYGTMTQEAVDLINAGTEALGPCPTD